MREGNAESVGISPKLPWSATAFLLILVFVIALVRPFAPNGTVEFFSKLVGRPLSLRVAPDTSIRLDDEITIDTKCQTEDLRWSHDGTEIVVECPAGLQVWTPDGRSLGSISVSNGWPQRHIQVLHDPIRILFLERSGNPITDKNGIWDPATYPNKDLIVSWDVEQGKTAVASDDTSAIDDFSADQDLREIALVSAPPVYGEVILQPLDGGPVKRTLHLDAGTSALRWLPSARALLLGGYDGVLRKFDLDTGQLRDLANIYATKFSSGGSSIGAVGGLALSPDGKSAATFMLTGGVRPAPGSNFIDQVAEASWEKEMGTTVEIRSTEDGHLISRMPGTQEEWAGAREIAWDPRDRFIAVAGRRGIFLWDWRTGTQSVRTYDTQGIVHKVAIDDDGSRLALTTVNGLRIFRIVENRQGAEP